ncbi:transposase [Patescibacteria group bacterium]|nr:transposase [Patescibacteria group bacterium]
MIKLIDIYEYNWTVNKLREFFVGRGFVEVPVQARLSILAACEDPTTISQFEFGGTRWPLPQTGQMWLEYELLKHPEVPGVFCISTSYRDEQHPIEGRHDKIFPMFEFESFGDMQDLMRLERELLAYLGFKSPMLEMNYSDIADHYGVEEIEAEQELLMSKDFAPVVFLKNFPFSTHPFWNMKHQGNDLFSKVDVILHGMETFGGAERSCNANEMRYNFYHISDGEYAGKLFGLFGRERVERELENYLSLAMRPRFGTGIGVTRLIRALKYEEVIKPEEPALARV